MTKPVNSISLLFAAREPEAAERLISCIRIRGPAVRARSLVDLAGVDALLLEERFHAIILVHSGANHELNRINDALFHAGRTTPVIVISDQNENQRLDMYESGAFAVVGKGLEELAALVVLRAVEHYLCSTQVHRLRSNLLELERQYLRVLEDSKDPVIYTRDGNCISTNRAGLEQLQLDSPGDLEGRSLADFVIPEQQELVRQWLEARTLEVTPGSERRPMTLRTELGKPFDADLIFTDATIEGEHCTVVRIAMPVESDGLEGLDALDPGTGLSNRQHLFREAERALNLAARSGRPFALLEVSVDEFERLQSEFGSNGSDILLMEVGRGIRDFFRESDTVAHLGDGFYGVLIPRVQRSELEQRLGALIRTIASREIDLGQESSRVTLSCGAVIADDAAPTMEDLLERARTGVEDVRRNGGNGYSFQKPPADTLARSRSDRLWKDRIQDAIAHDRIRLLYQPIVNLHGGAFPLFNVFVRLSGPDEEVYEPEDFLPAAERTGIAADIDRWIVSRALSRLADRIRTEPKTLFFLKLTRGSLIDGSVVLWLQEFLHRNRIPSGNVVVEIKEATIVTNLQAASSTARGLKAIGAQLCIDDFGNGLNPFHILRRIDADYIKLEGNLVRNLVRDEGSRDAIRRFTEGGHAKGKQIIVPLVEDAATLAVLYELGVNLVQGYFVHPPGEQLDLDFTQVL